MQQHVAYGDVDISENLSFHHIDLWQQPPQSPM